MAAADSQQKPGNLIFATAAPLRELTHLVGFVTVLQCERKMELHTFPGESRSLHFGKHWYVEHLDRRCILPKVEINVAREFFVLGPDCSLAQSQLHPGAFV